MKIMYKLHIRRTYLMVRLFGYMLSINQLMLTEVNRKRKVVSLAQF